MAHIVSFRFSTCNPSSETQREALRESRGAAGFHRELSDERVRGAITAGPLPKCAALREGDALHVYRVGRFGRDEIDIQATVRALLSTYGCPWRFAAYASLGERVC